MDVRSSTRRWPVLALVVATFACADQGDTELDSELDAVPPAAETTPPTTTGMLSAAEVMQAVTAVNEAEIAVGELALEKTQDETIRSFAEMMIADHTRLLEETQPGATTPGAGTADTMGTGTDTADAAATQPPPTTGTGTQGSAVIQQLEQQSQQAHSQLESLSGAEFDQAFIAQQIEAHQNALDLIDQQLLPSTQDPQVRMQLESARPVIEQHLQQAQQIQQQLGTGTGAADTTGTGTSGPAA